MKTPFKSTTTLAYGSLLAGLLGFSGAGLVQSAVEVHTADNARQAAERLAVAVDAYNRRASASLVPDTRILAGQAPEVAPVTQELDEAITAYNEAASDGLVPETRAPEAQASEPAPEIRQLRAQVAAYNANGGHLK